MTDSLRAEAEQLAQAIAENISAVRCDSSAHQRDFLPLIEAFARRQRAQALMDAADCLVRMPANEKLLYPDLRTWLRARAASEGSEP